MARLKVLKKLSKAAGTTNIKVVCDNASKPNQLQDNLQNYLKNNSITNTKIISLQFSSMGNQRDDGQGNEIYSYLLLHI